MGRRLRELVVFAIHDLTRDAPFSRLDLCSCRNVLIYLQAPLQKRVLRVLHYALSPDGFLMLGSSETVGDTPELFGEPAVGGALGDILRRRPAGDSRHAEVDELPDAVLDVQPQAAEGLHQRARLDATASELEVDGRLRFFDFGDALLTEPLSELRVPLGGLAHHLECPIDDPRLLRAVEPALEVWSDLVPLPELRAALPSAHRLARLERCESWLRCFPSMTDDELKEYGDAASYWLAAAAED